ncbi:MAG: sigma factor [Solirubrobacteraceae bacterium]
MSNDQEEPLEAQCEELVRDRFPEGLVRTLQRKFPTGRYHDFEDAVAEAFLKLVRKGRALENPRGYVTTVAVNEMLGTLARAARELLPDADEDDAEEIDRWADPTADEAINDATFDFMRAIVNGWESRNWRAATLIVLEAARLGEAISASELAGELEAQLGQEVLPQTARQWRKRGLDRLREQLHDADLWTDKELR